MTLEELFQIILARQKELPEGSYVASLFKSGDDRIIQKVGEEAVEVVIAAKNNNQERLIAEVGDLVFHTLVMLAARGVTLTDVLAELEKRRSAIKIK